MVLLRRQNDIVALVTGAPFPYSWWLEYLPPVHPSRHGGNPYNPYRREFSRGTGWPARSNPSGGSLPGLAPCPRGIIRERGTGRAISDRRRTAARRRDRV